MTVLVCIPTYNEAPSIAGIVGRTLAAVPEAHILIVDDGSPDGTGAIADGLALGDRRVHVLHRAEKAGLGAAYVAAFAWGMQSDHDVLVEMDADGSHRPEQLPELLAALDTADLIIGSRWVPGGRTVGWPLSRRLISRAGSLYARIALGIVERDATSGFRAYRADAIRMIDPATVASEGYSFQLEMLWRAVLAGLRVAEVPIVFADRELGQSKMSGRIVAEAVARVTIWGVVGLPTRHRRSSMRRLRADMLAPSHV